MLRRTDSGLWAFPGGRIEDGESAEQAAYREFLEETGHRLGSVGKQLMIRTKDDGDGPVTFTTFIADCNSEFIPRLNDEHSSFGWFNSEEVLTENRADSAALA